MNGTGWGWDVGSGAYNRATKEMADEYAFHEQQRAYRANALAAAQNRAAMQRGGFNYGSIAGMDPSSGNYIRDGIAPIEEAAADTQAAVQGKGAGLNTATDPTPAGKQVPVDVGWIHSIKSRQPVQKGWGDAIGDAWTEITTGVAQPAYKYVDVDKVVGQKQTGTLPENQAKAYNSKLGTIQKYLQSDGAKFAEKLSKVAGINPDYVHALWLQESGGNWYTPLKKGATGIGQVRQIALDDLKTRAQAAYKGNQTALKLIEGLPDKVGDMKYSDAAIASVLYAGMRHKLDRKNKDKESNIAEMGPLYFGADSKDAYGQTTKNYTTSLTGLYNAVLKSKGKDGQFIIDPNIALSPEDIAEARAKDSGETAQTTQQPAGLKQSGNYRRLENFGGPSQSPLGAEYTRAAQDILMLDNYKRAYMQTGAIDNYLQVAAQQTQMQMALSNKLAELGAFELEHSGSPHRLLALLNGSTGGNYQVQLRSDGKIDLYNGGKKVSGKGGYTAHDLATYIKNMVNEQARAQYLATQTEVMKQQAKLLEKQMDINGNITVAGINAQGQALRGAVAAQKANKPALLTNTPEGQTIMSQGEQSFYLVPGQDMGNGVMSAPQWKPIPIAGTYGFNNVLPQTQQKQ